MAIKDGVLREQLCQVGKLLYAKGLIAGTQGNLSCRTADGQFLITPAGKCKGMMQPEDIVLIDADGHAVESQQSPSSEFRVHLYGYQKRPDFNAAVHAHPPYATAFAIARLEIDVGEIPEGAASFGEIPILPFAEPGTQELAERLEGLIQDYHTLLLERHGVISFGGDLMEAFFRVEMAEQLSKTIYLANVLSEVSSVMDDEAFGFDDDAFPDDDETDMHPPRGRE